MLHLACSHTLTALQEDQGMWMALLPVPPPQLACPCRRKVQHWPLELTVQGPFSQYLKYETSGRNSVRMRPSNTNRRSNDLALQVIVVEDENGNIVRETMKDTDTLARYKTMHETLVYLSHLDHDDTESQMLEKLRLQVGGQPLLHA